MSSLCGRGRDGRPGRHLPGVRDRASRGVLGRAGGLRLVLLCPGASPRDRGGRDRARPPDHPGGTRTRHPAPRRGTPAPRGPAREPDLEPGRVEPPDAGQAPDQPARDRLAGLRPRGNPPVRDRHRPGRRRAGALRDERDPHSRPARGLAGGLRILAGDPRRRRLGHPPGGVPLESRARHRPARIRAAPDLASIQELAAAPPARHAGQRPHRAERRDVPPRRQGDRIGSDPPHRPGRCPDRHQPPCGRPRLPLPQRQSRRPRSRSAA